jgi:hypothetical protein
MSNTEQDRLKRAEKIARAKHMSKPDADNAVVVRDAGGRWVLEIYTAGHSVEEGKHK